MKITKEEFDKLPQLDRIEYRQKRDYIENNRLKGGAWDFLWNMLIIVGFVLVIALLFYNINPDSTFRLLNILPGIGRIIGAGTAILIFIDIIGIVITRKQIEKLNNEYFSVKAVRK